MKTQTIFLILIGMLFIITFFFNTIPIPVEERGLQGNDGEFNYGGMYWTSGLYELQVGNNLGVRYLVSIFLITTGGGYLINKI